ncbi:uncharacterized protein LOC115750587 isoform X4 [Rhodamnia argentea]|uniref:Uncharacterized protein LOC115750587 isoform X4 n=1 Tax=Rhodamnia argentea TaxID=178133 RepID=A0ABM3HG39_9MYRT|nr:uncharacterized protein LOC115750587 isoform X4 [Rhodamnia argentea]
MYASRLKCKKQRWSVVVQSSKSLRSHFQERAPSRPLSCIVVSEIHHLQFSSIRRYLSELPSSHGVAAGTYIKGLYPWHNSSLNSCQLRAYSSEGDGRNASEDKQEPTKDGSSIDSGKSMRDRETATDVVSGRDSHARLGERDQKEWLHNEKLAIESKKKDSPFLSRREKFKNEFLRRIVPWEKISVSWETFPYYINEHTKNTLVECVASHMKHKKINSSYGARLNSSSGRILLQSVPGTELFRERIVRALAQDLQVPLLVLDSSVLAPYDFGEDCSSESDDDRAESAEDRASESETEDENEASNEEEWNSSSEARSDGSDDEADVQATAEAALKKLVPCNLEDFAKRVSGESESSSESSKPEDVANSNQPKQQLKRGDRVKYIGPSQKISDDDRPLSTGQRGVVYEVSLDRVAVILDTNENKASGDEADETSTEQSTPPIWISVNDIEPDLDSQAEDCYIAMEALCEVLHSQQPLVVYFPDSSQWLSRAVTKANRSKFVNKVHEMFDQLQGPVVLICGQNKVETGSKEREKFTMILPNIGRLAKLPLSLKSLTEGLKANRRSDVDSIHNLFNNILHVHPPQEEHLLRTFNKQVEEDRKIIISRSNINELNQVLEEHELSCMDLLHVNTEGVILTRRKAEKVVGWAKNHYLSSCVHPAIKGDRLSLPRESLEVAIVRLKEQEAVSRETSLNFKNLARDDYERNFVSAVVPPGEVGVRFDDVGALEDVKDALNELVILPMRRPELFSRGNLLRPCKGILLFGPPGTGKTLLAKALATEAGANFISITGSTMTSKWFGDAEKLTKALFSFASRLAPVVIFVDEVDSLLGARGGSYEHEATRRMRNEFMAAWDGLRSKDSERILILGATNRPFDLDDAVIRRLPRRLYVDLPDAENRKKILKIILGQENLEHGFEIDKLASMTEGYSGSDLKNLCIAAAYRPVQELLEEEKKGSKNSSPTPRPLNLDDFLQSKSKVAPSVAYDAASMNELRKWNEQYGEGGSRRKSPFGF